MTWVRGGGVRKADVSGQIVPFSYLQWTGRTGNFSSESVYEEPRSL
jgi:hypothetical protein